MLVGDKLSYPAANETYCLLTAYLREEKIAGTYDKESITEFVNFLASILKQSENFVGVDRKKKLDD